MPIIEDDAWCKQYFQNVDCPDTFFIPTDDRQGYALYPAFCGIYNKLLICKTQQIEHRPHGFQSPFYPIFSKPIYNLRGSSTGSKVLCTKEEYDLHLQPGHLWMEFLEGEHISSDIAVVDGQPQQWWHVIGKPGNNHDGTFDYWIILNHEKPEIEKWIEKYLKGYTGMVNIETINKKIIEVHLRFADQWPDLYGKSFVQALLNLYTNKTWQYIEPLPKTAYSVVLFGEHGYKYIHPPQIPMKVHPNPSGGFRLAVINCFELENGIRAREQLRQYFLTTRH